MANEADLYTQLDTETWGEDRTVTSYAYDANGSMTNKTVLSAGGATNEIHDFTYNLEKRLVSSVITRYEGAQEIVTTSNYAYNQSGIRVRADSAIAVDGVPEVDSSKIFLVDSFNPTGFAQVLEERPAIGAPPTLSYTIGDAS